MPRGRWGAHVHRFQSRILHTPAAVSSSPFTTNQGKRSKSLREGGGAACVSWAINSAPRRTPSCRSCTHGLASRRFGRQQWMHCCPPLINTPLPTARSLSLRHVPSPYGTSSSTNQDHTDTQTRTHTHTVKLASCRGAIV